MDKSILAHILVARTITQASTLENIFNSYIAEYYTRSRNSDYTAQYLAFIFDILNTKRISLGVKIDMLFAVFSRLTDKKIERNIFDQWVSIRNKFAHGVVWDDEIVFEGAKYNIQEEADKFMELQQEINRTLDEFSELRGPHFDKYPLKNWPESRP